MKRTILSLVLAAGAFAGMLVEGRQLNAQASGTPVSTFLQADDAATKDRQWKIVTIELGPGAVDTRSIRPGTGIVYVLDGGGVLELDGKASLGLHPGVAAALNPQKAHVLKNTSETETLRVLIVLFGQKGQGPVAVATDGTHVSQVNGREAKSSEPKQSAKSRLGF